jgi:hypothetical protein
VFDEWKTEWPTGPPQASPAFYTEWWPSGAFCATLPKVFACAAHAVGCAGARDAAAAAPLQTRVAFAWRRGQRFGNQVCEQRHVSARETATCYRQAERAKGCFRSSRVSRRLAGRSCGQLALRAREPALRRRCVLWRCLCRRATPRAHVAGAVVSHVERPRDAGASEQRGRARTVLLMSRWRPSRVQSAVRDGRCGAAGPGCLRDGHRLGPSRARVGDVRGGQAENLLHDLQKLVKSCRAGPTRWKKGSSPQRERAAGHRQRPPGCLLLRVEHLVVDVVRQVPTLQRKSRPLRSNGRWWQPPWRGLRRPLLQRSAARDVLEGGCGLRRRPRQVVAAPRKLPKLARQSWSGRPV